MPVSLCIDYVRRQSADVAQQAVFHAHQIAVAHQRDSLAVNLRDAMHHIMGTVNPCQHHMSHLKRFGLLQNDTLLAAYNKRQHALAVDGQRDADTFVRQSARLLNNQLVDRSSRNGFMTQLGSSFVRQTLQMPSGHIHGQRILCLVQSVGYTLVPTFAADAGHQGNVGLDA